MWDFHDIVQEQICRDELEDLQEAPVFAKLRRVQYELEHLWAKARAQRGIVRAVRRDFLNGRHWETSVANPVNAYYLSQITQRNDKIAALESQISEKRTEVLCLETEARPIRDDIAIVEMHIQAHIEQQKRQVEDAIDQRRQQKRRKSTSNF